MYRTAFFGTPTFAIPSLKALMDHPEFDVVAVFSQPDSPSGRKLKLHPSPLKEWAESKEIQVLTPEKCSTQEFIQSFKELDIDVAVVVAFGQILPQALLDLCDKKFVNLHGSLLPRWRGAAPIQRAVMAGDKNTGVSLQVMVKKLDAGDVIGEKKTEILAFENSLELHDRLSVLGTELIKTDLLAYLKGDVVPSRQEESLVTYAHKIEKEEAIIVWNQHAQKIWNQIRGLAMGPGGVTFLNKKRLKVHRAKVINNINELKEIYQEQENLDLNLKKNQPGSIAFCTSAEIIVSCSENSFLILQEVQPESKPKMSVAAFLAGNICPTSFD